MNDRKREAPEGMISVERFAKNNGLNAENVIELIREGTYVGQIINGEWYVQNEDLDKDNQTTPSKRNNASPSTNAPPLSIFFFILAALSFLGTTILASEFWPDDPGYGYTWKIEAYTLSIIWFMVGLVEAAFFAAIGQGLFYLDQIVQNTSKQR